MKLLVYVIKNEICSILVKIKGMVLKTNMDDLDSQEKFSSGQTLKCHHDFETS